MNRWCAVTKNNDARIEIAPQMFPGRGERPAEAKCFNNLALFLNIFQMSFDGERNLEKSRLCSLLFLTIFLPGDSSRSNLLLCKYS